MNSEGTSRHRVRELVAVRTEADDRVGSHANIIGSMIGLKLRKGMPTGLVGITYFVRNKVPLEDLSPRLRVPKRITTGKTIVRTDVVAWPRMMEQTLTDASIIFDGQLQGTLTCFGRSRLGVFGVSCAHCLAGADRNYATPTAMSMYSKSQGEYVGAGMSFYAAFLPGPGIPGNFGYLDCGLFDLREPSLLSRAAASIPVPVAKDDHALVGKHLVASSALNAPGWPDKRRTAVVLGIYADALGERSDFVLHADAPGTFQGDSGMLWLTSDGRAAAIHARGEVMPAMEGSRLISAMAARRVAATLSVDLARG